MDLFGSKENVGKTKRFFVYYLCKIFTFGVLVPMGSFYKVRTYTDEKGIYKKYLGEDYEIEKNTKYSCIISNHISWNVKFY